MPMNFTFGMAGYLFNSKDRNWWTGADSVGTHALLLAVAWSHPNDNIEVYNLGLEYGYQDMAFLRFGKKINGIHRYNWEDYQRKVDRGEDATNRDPFLEYPLFSETGKFFQDGAALGAGVKLAKIGLTIDYAFTGISYLDYIHRFSIGYKFKKLVF
jgi:hypothetical protein